MGERKLSRLIHKAPLDIPQRKLEISQAKPFWAEVWSQAFRRAVPVLWYFGAVQFVLLGAIGIVLVAYFTKVSWEQIKAEFWTNFFLALGPSLLVYGIAVLWFAATVPAMKFLEVTETLGKDVESLNNRINELEANQKDKNTKLEAIERLEALYVEGDELFKENVGGDANFLSWLERVSAWIIRVAENLPREERFGFETLGEWAVLSKPVGTLGTGAAINAYMREGKTYVGGKLSKLRKIIMRLSNTVEST